MSKNLRRTKKGSETRLKLQNIGQIKEADIKFGDLTVLVGPQATGKSVFLQLLRLVLDRQYIHQQYQRLNQSWEDGKTFLRYYLGEGMEESWVELPAGGGSYLAFNGRRYDLENLAETKGRPRENTSPRGFYVPAHRAFALYWGWPILVLNFIQTHSFVLWDFIEQLALLLGRALKLEEEPLGRFAKPFREVLQRDIFSGFDLRISKSQGSERLVLQRGRQKPIPFLGWSTGQREVVPLLLALSWLLPSGGTTRRQSFEWVIIEEPEMGLHPKAISDVLLIVLDLLERGYRVCISTHSLVVLELVWTLVNAKENNGDADDILKLFEIQKDQQVQVLHIAQSALEKEYKVYYFEPDEKGMVTVKDISRLDPSSEDLWGGLSKFSAKANDIVAEVVTKSYARSESDQVVALHVREESE
jgi:energy-coupling factor transporter ATP-binding protein EcfA2